MSQSLKDGGGEGVGSREMGRAGNTNVPHPRGTGVPGFFHGKGWKINVELVSIPDACVQAARGPPETGGSEEAVGAKS